MLVRPDASLGVDDYLFHRLNAGANSSTSFYANWDTATKLAYSINANSVVNYAVSDVNFIVPGQWQYLIGVTDMAGLYGGAQKVRLFRAFTPGYIEEATYANTQDNATTPVDASSVTRIGCRTVSTYRPWYGNIAYVGVWNTALSVSEIALQTKYLFPFARPSSCVLSTRLGLFGSGVQYNEAPTGIHGSIVGSVTRGVSAPVAPAPVKGLYWQVGTQPTPAAPVGGSTEASQSLYLEGATFFPFTDTFTGSNNDPWYAGKWLSEAS